MKFTFENLGYVDKGDVELGDLTLICGPNNVGKTYISYAIYGLMRDFKELADFALERSEITDLKTQGSLRIDLSRYLNKLPDYLKKASEEFAGRLDTYFSVSEDFFSNSKTEFSYANLVVDIDREFKSTAKFGKSESLIFDKAPGSNDLTIALQVQGESKLPNRIINQVIGEVIGECLFNSALPKPFIVTSERTGIALFYKELDISKNALFEHMAENEKLDPVKMFNIFRSRYAQPIHDNINIIRDYENLSKQKSFIREDKELCRSILDALHDLLGGSFKAVDKQVVFIPKKEKGRNKLTIPFYVASSSVKSLFLIDLYINCLAKKNGMLIIDEPELNLHPDNQRKMACLLARLVNAGIKILITTHSDYLIREINNRIMLNSDVDSKASIMQREGILNGDILRPDQVKAYSLKSDHKIDSIEVTKYGVNMAIFDNLIAKANNLTDDIYYNLKE